MSARTENGKTTPNNAAQSGVSSTRLYIGNIAKGTTEQELTDHFAKHGGGSKIKDVRLKNGYGFIEFADRLDAQDVVPAYHGTMYKNERLMVQFARGPRKAENNANQDRASFRNRRTPFKTIITGLPPETSWQDLKDFARTAGFTVVFSDMDRDGRGIIEFESAKDMHTAIEKLNDTKFKNSFSVRCVAEEDRGRDNRQRSRSPMRRYYPSGPPEDYDYRHMQHPYSPGREYRHRTPPPSRDWYERDRYGRPPPGGHMPRGPPMEDYPPHHYHQQPMGWGPHPMSRRYDDPYGPQGYPPHGRGPYGPPSPGRHRSPMRSGYSDGFDPRGPSRPW